MGGESLQDVYETLVRRRRVVLDGEQVLDAIRTAGGVVPLGGGAGATARSSAADAGSSFWHLALRICQLPTSSTRDQLQKALTQVAIQAKIEIPSDNEEPGSVVCWRAVNKICARHYSDRRAFFAVRIELFRIALFLSPEQHANFYVVEEIVDELLKDGLLDALVEEIKGRQSVEPPSFFSQSEQTLQLHARSVHFAKQAQRAWEKQLLDEEMLLRNLLLLVLYSSKEKLDVTRAVQFTKTIHVRHVISHSLVLILLAVLVMLMCFLHSSNGQRRSYRRYFRKVHKWNFKIL